MKFFVKGLTVHPKLRYQTIDPLHLLLLYCRPITPSLSLVEKLAISAHTSFCLLIHKTTLAVSDCQVKISMIFRCTYSCPSSLTQAVISFFLPTLSYLGTDPLYHTYLLISKAVIHIFLLTSLPRQ